MNRLSEDTLEPVASRLREAYRGHSTTEVNEALWHSTKAVCVHNKHVSKNEGNRQRTAGKRAKMAAKYREDGDLP